MTQETQKELIANSTDELLSFDDAIKLLDTSKSTLYKLLSLDEIKGVKVGKQWRFRKTDLIAYLQRGPVAVAIDPTAHGELDVELSYFRSEIASVNPDSSKSAPAFEDLSAEGKIGALAQCILEYAFRSGSSDIQLEPMGESLRLRFRIDGLLHVIRQIPIRLNESLTTRFKEMSSMNLGEKRLPQDGRIRFHLDKVELDIRTSLVPTNFGESFSMRILDRNAAFRTQGDLGMSAETLSSLRGCLDRPNGLILAIGPSGSGKTSLVYSCLADLNSTTVKIVTAEDLIEYQIPGITQVQTSPRIGMTLAAALRSCLRQDPDVVMCSELRDQETASTAFDGALKGVGLLSTMIANDIPGAIQRLIDMGVEKYMITSALNAVISSRRMRMLCPHCKTAGNQELSRAAIGRATRLDINSGYSVPDSAVFYEPVGCPKCRGIGFLGRIGIFELLVCNPKLVGNLIECPSPDGMQRIALDSGMRTLLMDGIRRAASGDTSINEVLRVTDTSL